MLYLSLFAALSQPQFMATTPTRVDDPQTTVIDDQDQLFKSTWDTTKVTLNHTIDSWFDEQGFIKHIGSYCIRHVSSGSVLRCKDRRGNQVLIITSDVGNIAITRVVKGARIKFRVDGDSSVLTLMGFEGDIALLLGDESRQCKTNIGHRLKGLHEAFNGFTTRQTRHNRCTLSELIKQ